MGKSLSSGLEAQIREGIRERKNAGRQRGRGDAPRERRPRAKRFPIYAVILNASLPAGTFLQPTSTTATRCVLNTSTNEYEQLGSEYDLRVWNHSSRSYDDDTPGAAIPVDGDHYWFFGDCEAWENRPAVPGSE